MDFFIVMIIGAIGLFLIFELINRFAPDFVKSLLKEAFDFLLKGK